MPRITQLCRLCRPVNICYAFLVVAAFLAGNQINWLGRPSSSSSSSLTDDGVVSFQRRLRRLDRSHKQKEQQYDWQSPLPQMTAGNDGNNSLYTDSSLEAKSDGNNSLYTDSSLEAKSDGNNSLFTDSSLEAKSDGNNSLFTDSSLEAKSGKCCDDDTGPLEPIKEDNNVTVSSFNNASSLPWEQQMKQIQRERKAVLVDACKSYANQTYIKLEDFASNPENLVSFIYNDKYKIIYNFVHKVASQHLTQLLIRLDGKSNPENNKLYQYNRLYGLNFGAVIMRLRTYKKFIFVRDPFARFVSAYKNKFIAYPDNKFIKQTAAVISRHYRDAADKKKSNRPEDVTFLEFIRYITGYHYGNRANTHWSSYVARNKVCLLKHDFIGKLETMEEDSKYFFKHLLHAGNTDRAFIPDGRKDSVTKKTKSLRDMYATIPKANLKHLLKYYEADFRVFGYSTTSVLK